MAAAVRTIAAQGLSAPTAVIAKVAGVSNGALFTYFDTKADLLNRLYVELKIEMAEVVLTNLPAQAEVRQQMHHIWNQWVHWAIEHPEKRRTLAYLGVSDQVTRESHREAGRSQVEVASVLERARSTGPLHDAPMMFVLSLMNGVAEATIEFVARDPADAEMHVAAGFDALWRILT